MENRFIANELTMPNYADFFIIAGPCVIESELITMQIAEKIAELSAKHQVPFVFKASYEKANRSSIDSYTGPGMKEGLRILSKVRDTFKMLPVLTDIHHPENADEVADVVDIVQIPAFLCRQTDLLIAAGKSDKIVNIKKGQFLSPAEMGNVAEKVLSTGNEKIMLTERGTFFGYNNLVVDFRAFMEMKKMGYPVIYDATHSLQKPALLGKTTAGQPEYVKQMAMAAMATGAVDGLFIETHPEPKDAMSDAQAMLALDKLEELIIAVKTIRKAVRG